MSDRIGRPRKGSLYWTKSGWRARLTVDVDGAPVQKSFDLETTSKAAAKVKLKRLAKQHVAPAVLASEAKRIETFTDAAERIVGESTAVDTRERAVLTDEELARYLAWEYPGKGHRMAVLERQTMACLSRMFGGVRVGVGSHLKPRESEPLELAA